MRHSGTHGRARILSATAVLVLVASACGSTPPGTQRPSGPALEVPQPAPEAATDSSAPIAVADPAAPGPSGPAAATVPRSRQDLIADALAGGRIDHVTSLVYRGYARFGLPDLPDEYASAPSRGDDSALFNEIVDLLPSLSQADRQRLRPLIARPTEPDSIFARGLAITSPGGVHRPQAFTHGARIIPDAPFATTAAECRGWTDSGSASTHFKVWACTAGDPASAATDVATVASLLEELWTPMTRRPPEGMGPPIPDGSGPNVARELGGDGRIDVYALFGGEGVYRDSLHDVPQDSIAAAVPSPPYYDAAGNALKTSSGFILVNRARIAERDQMRRDLIHEFFHVLQNAHNRKGPFRGTEAHWFSEASATWAETYYFRAGSAIVHTWFSSVFQLSHLGLESTTGDHPYAAYIWPFFMEQEAGAAAIFKAWVGIETAGPGDFRKVSDAIDAQIPFATRFRDFAVRNLNRQLELSSAHLKRYVEVDGQFPDGAAPVPIESGEISTAATLRSGAVSIEPLAASYAYLVADDDARDVTIDLSALSPVKNVDGDALLHIAGKWERRAFQGTELHLCRDDPADNFDYLFLVLSNHGRAEGDRVTGDFAARARKGCGDLVGTINWQATTQVTYDAGGADNSVDDVTISVRYDGQGNSWVNDGSSFSWKGSEDINSPSSNCSAFTSTSTTVGGGDFSGAVERIDVSVNAANRTVSVVAVVTGELFTHQTRESEEGPGAPVCVTHEADSTQGGPDDPGDWGQNPTCGHGGESVDGRISDDGRTVDFTCSSGDTRQVNGNSTETTTYVVTGHLRFVRGAP